MRCQENYYLYQETIKKWGYMKVTGNDAALPYSIPMIP